MRRKEELFYSNEFLIMQKPRKEQSFRGCTILNGNDYLIRVM